MLHKHIAIMGGGYAGSLAALVCARSAARVTLVERHPWSASEDFAQTPQSEHVHIMSQRGQMMLEQLLPGILAELIAKGAKKVDWAQNTIWDGPLGRYPQFDSGVKTLVFSRKLLDRIFFDRIIASANITHMKAVVKDLSFRGDSLATIHLVGGCTIDDADLYLDARGRSAETSAQLMALTGPIPQRSIPNSIRYASTVLDRSYKPNDQIQQYYRQPSAGETPLGYYASPIEGDRLIFTIVDYSGRITRPFAAFRDHPLLRDVAITKTKTFGKLGSVHNRFGAARQWPNNYLVIGDAVCRLNPIYGHGLTVCTAMVAALADGLQLPGKLSTHRLQKQFDRIVRVPWSFVALGKGFGVGRHYMNLLLKASLQSNALHKTSLEVLHLVRSPLAFVAPATIGRVFLAITSTQLRHLILPCRQRTARVSSWVVR